MLYFVLRVPDTGKKKTSLATFTQKQIDYEENKNSGHPQTSKEQGRKEPKKINQLEQLANLVSDKLYEGDVKGAIRIVSSEEIFAAHTELQVENSRRSIQSNLKTEASLR